MNVLEGILLVTMLGLLALIAKLRSDLVYTRWTNARLASMLLVQSKPGMEFWNVADPTDLATYVEGQIPLQARFRQRDQYQQR